MRAERFMGTIFLCVIMLFMTLAMSEFATRQARKIINPEPVKEPLIIHWEELYPFTEGKPRLIPHKEETLIERVRGRLDDYTSKFLVGYQRIVEAARKYEDIVHWNIAAISDYNPVVKLNDGYLTTFWTSMDVKQDADSVKEFADFCAEKNIDFMYINLPNKICKSYDKDISGVLDYSNQNADRFLSLLKESGVRYYDLREILHDEGRNHHEAFYVTDHHWKGETGLWAAGHVLKFLRDDCGWPVDPEIIAPENFRYVVYPEWFLGSEGKKLTLSRVKPDDFTMIYPKFETSIKFEVPNAGINAEGDLSVIYNMEQIEPKDYYGKSPYSVYIYADRPLIRIENRLIGNGKSALVIHESFSNCVIPFIATGVECTYSIDMRHFTGSIKSFIEAEKPDAVIIMYYAKVPGRTSNPLMLPENKRMYCFM